MIGLAYLAIINGYIGSLPWLTAMVACPWGAYGVSQAMYYKKSEKENSKDGIKYETVMAEINAKYNNIPIPEIDWTIPSNSLEIEKNNEDTQSQKIDLDYGI